MARPRPRVMYFKDFTGGLNLTTQRQNLRFNETPDCLNVDFHARGGFVSRQGYLNATTDANMSSSAGYLVGYYSFGTEMLWGISASGQLWTWNGSVATHVATQISDDLTRRVRGVVWGDKLYLANAVIGGTLTMRSWNGSAYTTLGNVANDNYSAPSGANAPLARLIADHSGHLWWADTVESGTRHRSRLRWSHPLQPENFATADYFDIEPDDQTNEITALVPFGSMLLVFKRRGVFAVYGQNRDEFTVERLSVQTGTVSQETVTTSPTSCYWWSTDGDLVEFDGRDIKSIGERISGVVRDGTITPGLGTHLLSWAGNRLWLNLVDSPEHLCFVFDPYVGQNGAWTKYDTNITSMVWWRKNDGSNSVMIRLASTVGVHDFSRTDQMLDDNGVDDPVHVMAYYVTHWIVGSDSALVKRWRRMHVTAWCGDECELLVQVRGDFDEGTVRREFTIMIHGLTGGMQWGEPWGTPWSGDADVFTFDRLPNAGRFHAVQFKFMVEDHSTRWAVDSFALPYVEKGYK